MSSAGGRGISLGPLEKRFEVAAVSLGGDVLWVEAQDFIELFAGFGEAAGAHAGDTQVDAGEEVIGAQANDRGEFLAGRLKVLSQAEFDGEQVTSFPIMGVEGNGLAEGFGGLVTPAEGGERIGEVSEDPGMVGVALANVLVYGDGFLEFFLGIKNSTDLEPGFLEVGPQVQGQVE